MLGRRNQKLLQGKKEKVEQEQERIEGVLRQIKTQRQLAKETAKQNQTPLEYVLSSFSRTHISIVNLAQKSTSWASEMEHEDELELGDTTWALEFRPKRKEKKHATTLNRKGIQKKLVNRPLIRHSLVFQEHNQSIISLTCIVVLNTTQLKVVFVSSSSDRPEKTLEKMLFDLAIFFSFKK